MRITFWPASPRLLPHQGSYAYLSLFTGQQCCFRRCASFLGTVSRHCNLSILPSYLSPISFLRLTPFPPFASQTIGFIAVKQKKHKFLKMLLARDLIDPKATVVRTSVFSFPLFTVEMTCNIQNRRGIYTTQGMYPSCICA